MPSTRRVVSLYQWEGWVCGEPHSTAQQASYLASLGFSATTILEATKQRETRLDLDFVVTHLNQHTQDHYTEEGGKASKQRILSHSVDLH